MPALAVDISVGGLGILSDDEIGLDQFLVQLTLEERTVTALVSRAGSVPGKLRGGEAWRTGGKFIGITADHWDALSRFVANLPATHNDKLRLDLIRCKRGRTMRRDCCRKRRSQMLLGELVKLKRLAPLHARPSSRSSSCAILERPTAKASTCTCCASSRASSKPHHVNNYVTQFISMIRYRGSSRSRWTSRVSLSTVISLPLSSKVKRVR